MLDSQISWAMSLCSLQDRLPWFNIIIPSRSSSSAPAAQGMPSTIAYTSMLEIHGKGCATVLSVLCVGPHWVCPMQFNG